MSLQIAGPDPVPESHQHIVGVDVGQRFLAVATDTLNRTHFFAGREARAKADHSARLRKRLQHKGTRSATRLLTVIAGRERRLKHDRNHLISRHLVDAYPHSLIGLEDLTHIRERTNRKRRHGKKATVKQRRANRHASQWAFAELQGYVAYKALLAGSMAVKVDAYKTTDTPRGLKPHGFSGEPADEMTVSIPAASRLKAVSPPTGRGVHRGVAWVAQNNHRW